MSDNRLPFANRQRYDYVINTLAAVIVIHREGFRQWTCQP